MKTISILSCIFFTLNIYSNVFIAEAVKVRGEVTQLSPGAKSARAIAVGDKFLEDTSILTGAKSFIKLKFIDNSEVNLGPESKIVVSEMKKGEPGVISLLKGKIRTEVEKSSNANINKFFIKTRTAAMGVRGTEFQTIYNPENKVTSLLTYKGEVAMAKIDDNQYRKLEMGETKIEVTRNEESKEIEINRVKNSTIDENKELNKILSSKNAVVVPPGQNSMASEQLVKATLPVQISPVQLNILYKNDEFKEKDLDNAKVLDQKNLKDIKLDLKVAAQQAPLEGISNSKTGDFAPRAGGFIDTKTGLYVAPDTDAKIDSTLGVYSSDKMGNIDQDTGAYLAPKGLKLDAVKGFVLENESTDPKLIAMKNDLNGTIAKDILVKKSSDNDEDVNYNIYEKFVKNEIYLSLMTDTQKLKLNANQQNAQFYSLNADQDNFKLAFEWRLASANRFRPLIGFDFTNVNFKNSLPNSFSTESRKVYSVYLGGMVSLNRNFDLFTKVGEYQDHYAEQSATANTYTLRRVVATRFTVGAHSVFFSDKKFPLEFDLWGHYQFRKRLNTIKINDGGGIGLSLGSNYKISKRDSIYFGIWTQSQYIKVESPSNENRQERNDGGIKLTYLFQF